MRLKRMYWIEIINFPRLCLMSSLPISDHSIARSQSMSYEHSSFSFSFSFSFIKCKPNYCHLSFLILIHIPFPLDVPTNTSFFLFPHSNLPPSINLHRTSKLTSPSSSLTSPNLQAHHLSSLLHHHSKSPFGCETNGGLLVARMGKSFNLFSVSRAMLSF